MSSRMTISAFRYLIYIAEKAGFDEDKIKIMNGLATELCFPLYELNGDYVQAHGSNPSGHSLTVFVNNIVNSLYLRYAYYYIQSPEKPLFKQVVSVACYGDDNKMSVRKGYDWFNHTAIAECLKTFGIKYTMADKTSESKPFINNKECSFLKRNAVWSDLYECYLPPIEIMTIEKMLHCYLASDCLNDEQHTSVAINNALRELFFHGREIYEKFESDLNLIIKKNNLDIYFDGKKVPTYEDHERWYVCSYRQELLETKFKHYKNYCINYVDEMTSDVSKLMAQGMCECQNVDTGYHDIVFCGIEQYCRLVNIDSDLNRMPYLGLSPNSTIFNGIIQPLNLKICIAKNINENYNKNMGVFEKETVVFGDGNEQISNSIEHHPDKTFNISSIDNVALQQFLERPLLIKNWTWTPNISLTDTFNPWTLFFSNARVSNRLNNYALIHCKLNVKFIINGNPFYYGRLLIDYQPLFDYDNVTLWDPTNSLGLISASQRLHIKVDPCISKAGTLILPFLLNRNAAYLPAGNIKENGIIHIRTMADLQHANGSTAGIGISAYAWLSDVKLSMPTNVNMATLTAQSDEYSVTPVSQKISNAATMVGKLSTIPTIGPYVKATEMVMNGIASIARALGYSKPLNIDDYNNIRPNYISRLAPSNCGDNSDKLALDIKNELTIDPRTFGLSDIDELSINYIAQVESFLTNFAWLQTNIENDVLFSCRVRPQYFPNDGSIICMPACSFCALPFKFWRGSMKYRFEVICSDMHKGRLKIVFDPYSGSTIPEENVQFTEIFDLSETKDITLKIGWASTKPYLQTRSLVTSDPGFRTTVYTNASTLLTNGNLSVYVLNPLTLPSASTANVSVNVYVSMCDDVEFAVPFESNFENSAYQYIESYSPQSEEFCDENCANPSETNPDREILSSLSVSDATTCVFIGEKICNFRTYLKRFSLHSIKQVPVGIVTTVLLGFKSIVSDFPYYRGSLPTGSSVLQTHNDSYTTILNYLTPAYLMMRGSLRQKYILLNLDDTYSSKAFINRSSSTNIISSEVSANVDTSTIDTLRSGYQSYTSSYANGASVTIANKMPVLEVEIPFYSNVRFRTAKDRAFVLGTDYSPAYNCHELGLFCRKADVDNTVLYERYVSVGEDFTLAGFQGAPPISIVTY